MKNKNTQSKMTNGVSTTAPEITPDDQQISNVLHSFSQTTSIHGARFIGDKDMFTLHRYAPALYCNYQIQL